MKNKSKYIIATAAIIPMLYLCIQKEKQNTSFACHVTFTQHYDGDRFNFWLEYYFSYNQGILHLIGKTKHGDINRKILFSFKNNGDIYNLTSIKSNKLTNDDIKDEFTSKLLPLFFYNDGSNMTLKINNLDNGNKLFTIGEIPTYVCNAR